LDINFLYETEPKRPLQLDHKTSKQIYIINKYNATQTFVKDTWPPDFELCDCEEELVVVEGYPIPWRLLGKNMKTTLETAPTIGGRTLSKVFSKDLDTG
jgi:hypothetical protein